MARIQTSGGRVKIVHECARVYLATDDVPGLAMSRSLGDYVAHSAGVSSIPEIFEYDVTSLFLDHQEEESECHTEDYYRSSMKSRPSTSVKPLSTIRSVLLIATDGVYDMMSNDEATAIAFKYWGDPASGTDAIVARTSEKWMATWGLADDTSVCIVNLEHSCLNN